MANLRELREQAGLTQMAIAVKAGLHISHYQKIEQGGVPSPGLDTLKALAGALNVTLEEVAKALGNGRSAAAGM